MNEIDLVEEHGFRREALAQLAAVRDSGAVNMHNMGGVRIVAEKVGFEELVALMEDLDEEPATPRYEGYMAYLRELGETRS